MRFGRAVIVPTILALGATGSILAGSAVAVAVAQAPTVHVESTVPLMQPGLYFHA
jgi:hypothetical protein